MGKSVIYGAGPLLVIRTYIKRYLFTSPRIITFKENKLRNLPKLLVTLSTIIPTSKGVTILGQNRRGNVRDIPPNGTAVRHAVSLLKL
jgi:hypothetical protein